MAKSKAPQIQIPSARSEDQPATRRMLSLVRDELKSDIRGLESKMESGFQKVGSDIQRLESGFQKVGSDIQRLESGFQKMGSDLQRLESNIQRLESGIHKMESGNSRMQLLLEEQNANNRIVLEGLQTLWHRQDRLEERLR